MTEPGPMGEWTFKDLAAHLLGWRNRTIARLEAAAGRVEKPPANPWPAELDDDDDDQRLDPGTQPDDRTVRQVLDDVDRSYERPRERRRGAPAGGS